MWASVYADTATVQALIGAGADLNLQSKVTFEVYCGAHQPACCVSLALFVRVI
jgi:hypothetical protein